MEQLLGPEDARLVEGLRAGDEAAFAALMRMYGAAMLRVAQMYVSSRAVAEEVVQDAWIGVLRGIGRFEGRSVAQDVVVSDRRQHGQDPRRARVSKRSLLVAR